MSSTTDLTSGKKKPLCAKDVRCYDYLIRPCLRPQGHDGGCNPFSDTPSLYVTQDVKSKKEVK